jgi:hypothetical protein
MLRERESIQVRDALPRTKKLTSGPAFGNGCVGLHSDDLHNHLLDYNSNKRINQAAKKRKSKELL